MKLSLPTVNLNTFTVGADDARLTFADYFAPDLELLKPYADEGLAVIADDHVATTPKGELFVRNLAMCFDRYWREKHEKSTTPTFSRTV